MTAVPPASLPELQQAFAALSTSLASEDTTCGAQQLVHGSDRLSAHDRMQIYANMFIWRQIDSLLEDFPKLAALSGDGFYSLCEAYLAAHPSQHYSLARLGRCLPSYLATEQLRGDLSDLAALEWARCEVFDEATVPTLCALQLADVAQGLTIIPALRTLRLAHDAVGVWKAMEDGVAVPSLLPAATCVVVWRKGFDVFHVRLDPLEAEAFARAVAGHDLSRICEVFAEQPDPIGAALRVIGSWFSEGWIAQGWIVQGARAT